MDWRTGAEGIGVHPAADSVLDSLLCHLLGSISLKLTDNGKGW
jgi:hypothetical protein